MAQERRMGQSEGPKANSSPDTTLNQFRRRALRALRLFPPTGDGHSARARCTAAELGWRTCLAG